MGAVPLLVVSRDPDCAQSLRDLAGPGWAVESVADRVTALARLDASPGGVVVAHATEDHVPTELLAAVAERWPNIVRLVAAAPDAMVQAIHVVNEAGVLGWLLLPLDDELTTALLERAAERHHKQQSEVQTIAELRAALDQMQGQIAEIEQQSIASQANIDAETELWDRQYLVERLEDEANRLARYGTSFGVLWFEVDAEPSKLEAAVAELLRSFVRRVDVCARFAPRTFVVVCPNTDEDGMVRLPERLHDALRAARLPGAPVGVLPATVIATIDLTEGQLAADEILARVRAAAGRARVTGDVAHWSVEHDGP